ncbi:hypothetical protein RF11_05750 [Thelohanellus kitauei]|uniref:Uncharacterized protein n=1 Tax=Thelohanellus kitauei TaxID=669202 RepID=A0A0C2J8Z0_THEKT|nr:hypothetical protein RF11_05750 [Thelohanellus kitauei]
MKPNDIRGSKKYKYPHNFLIFCEEMHTDKVEVFLTTVMEVYKPVPVHCKTNFTSTEMRCFSRATIPSRGSARLILAKHSSPFLCPLGLQYQSGIRSLGRIDEDEHMMLGLPWLFNTL